MYSHSFPLYMYGDHLRGSLEGVAAVKDMTV
jgi:hypothetical protein